MEGSSPTWGAGVLLAVASSAASPSRLRLDPESGAPPPASVAPTPKLDPASDPAVFCAAKALAAAAILSMSTRSSLRFLATPKSTCEYRSSALNLDRQSTVPSEFFMLRCCAPLRILPLTSLSRRVSPSPILARCVASNCSACLHPSPCFVVSTTLPRRAWYTSPAAYFIPL